MAGVTLQAGPEAVLKQTQMTAAWVVHAPAGAASER
jgi:hypothetical protein